MIVYAVTEWVDNDGDERGGNILGIFSTEDQAERLRDRVGAYDTTVEEYVIDDPAIEFEYFSFDCYDVVVVPHNGTVKVREVMFDRRWRNDTPTAYVEQYIFPPSIHVSHIAANSEEEALAKARAAIDKQMEYSDALIKRSQSVIDLIRASVGEIEKVLE